VKRRGEREGEREREREKSDEWFVDIDSVEQ
jgi:hypothetical protein